MIYFNIILQYTPGFSTLSYIRNFRLKFCIYLSSPNACYMPSLYQPRLNQINLIKSTTHEIFNQKHCWPLWSRGLIHVRLGPPEHCYRGFETRSRYMYAFLCVVLACVGRGLVMGRPLVQGVLPKCPKGFIVSEPVLNLKRPGCQIRETYNSIIKLK
jgi:hypothetical protein